MQLICNVHTFLVAIRDIFNIYVPVVIMYFFLLFTVGPYNSKTNVQGKYKTATTA